MKCLICPETRCIEMAHIVPKAITNQIRDFDNVWTMPLCSTHHRCYDYGRLTKQEMLIIEPYILAGMEAAVSLYKNIRPRQGNVETHKNITQHTKAAIVKWVRGNWEALYGSAR